MIWLVYAAVAGAILLYVFLQTKCLIGWSGRYRLLGILPIFWLVSWGAVVMHTMTQEDSTSNLWPFEAIAGCAPALVLLFILIMFHFVNTGQWFKTPRT